jgi:hypothetical protein
MGLKTLRHPRPMLTLIIRHADSIYSITEVLRIPFWDESIKGWTLVHRDCYIQPRESRYTPSLNLGARRRGGLGPGSSNPHGPPDAECAELRKSPDSGKSAGWIATAP